MGRQTKSHRSGMEHKSQPDSSSNTSKNVVGSRRSKRTEGTANNCTSSSMSSNEAIAPTAKRSKKRESSAVVEETFFEEKDDDHLLGIFPEELWTLILNFLTDPNDFSTVSNASPFFRKILAPKRTLFLFPKVWDVLGMKYELADDEVYCGYNLQPENVAFMNQRDGMFDELTEADRVGYVRFLNLPFYRDILSIRLVCRKWNFTLDYFYQHRGNHYYMKGDPYMNKLESDCDRYDDSDRSVGGWTNLLFYAKHRTMITKCLEHFEHTHNRNGLASERSPFIGRSVTFRTMDNSRFPNCGPHPQEEPGYHNQQYCDAISRLLRKYGHHFWYCTMAVEDTFGTRIQYYLQIKEWLELMPNLKALSMVYSTIQMLPLEPHYSRLVPVNVHSKPLELRQLKGIISTDPLPKLENLEYLYMRDMPNPLFHEFLRQGDTVTMLECKRDKDFRRWDYDLSLKPLNNLTQLSLEIFKEEEFVLLEASEGNWKLTKLYLSLKHCPYLPWPRIFKMLETKWGKTLTNVLLKLPKADKKKDGNEIMRKCIQYELNLPQVKRLKVEMYNISSVDFILPMKSVMEWLEVTFKLGADAGGNTKLVNKLKEKQKIKLLGYYEELVESNIWSLLPLLKRIDLIDICEKDTSICENDWFCTRGQWIKKMAEASTTTKAGN